MLWRYLQKKIWEMTLAVMGCLGVISSIYTDVFILSDQLQEASVTEISQELILLATAMQLLSNARRDKARRPVLLLMSGFFTVLLIREMDFALDLLAHGCWLWFALVITFVSLFQAFLYGQQTLNGLADFMCRAAWGQMCAGLITVLIFSRFMGINDLWQCLLGKDFPRMAKNMVEEGTELFGYMLCFFFC